MKSTGIVRKVDELGRVVIPIELRRTLGINIKDALEIYVDGEKIVQNTNLPVFSVATQTISQFSGRIVCQDCISKMMDWQIILILAFIYSTSTALLKQSTLAVIRLL